MIEFKCDSVEFCYYADSLQSCSSPSQHPSARIPHVIAILRNRIVLLAIKCRREKLFGQDVTDWRRTRYYYKLPVCFSPLQVPPFTCSIQFASNNSSTTEKQGVFRNEFLLFLTLPLIPTTGIEKEKSSYFRLCRVGWERQPLQLIRRIQ